MLAGFNRYITTQEQAKGRPLNREELMGCIGCHAPGMRFASDDEFARLASLVKANQRDALVGLSVDCVACHALHGSGHPETRPPDDLGQLVLHGPISNPLRTVHETQFTASMEKSEFCKGCHTYVRPAEMHVNADWDIVCSLTYDAWAAGPYGTNAGAARQECQTCHMEKKDGTAAAVPGLQVPTRRISSHLFPGWHNADWMQRAAALSLESRAGASAGAIELTVHIDNKAGHRFPDT
jgi:cytochrome c553